MIKHAYHKASIPWWAQHFKVDVHQGLSECRSPKILSCATPDEYHMSWFNIFEPWRGIFNVKNEFCSNFDVCAKRIEACVKVGRGSCVYSQQQWHHYRACMMLCDIITQDTSVFPLNDKVLLISVNGHVRREEWRHPHVWLDVCLYMSVPKSHLNKTSFLILGPLCVIAIKSRNRHNDDQNFFNSFFPLKSNMSTCDVFLPTKPGSRGSVVAIRAGFALWDEWAIFPTRPGDMYGEKKTPYSMAFPTVNTGHVFIMSFKGKPGSGLRKYLVFDLKLWSRCERMN